MQPAGMLAQLAADGRAPRAAATDLDAPVPPCPGWTVTDAVEHTAMVGRSVADGAAGTR
jgi:hypothetical protein